MDIQQLDLGPTIDLVLLHYPKAAPLMSLEATIMEQWKAISDFTASGGARAAGVSQFCKGAFKAIDAIAPPPPVMPVVNQVGWHVGMGNNPCGVPSMCSARTSPNVTVMAYSPLAEASSLLLNSTTAKQIAARHAASPAQVALRWDWSTSNFERSMQATPSLPHRMTLRLRQEEEVAQIEGSKTHSTKNHSKTGLNTRHKII